MRLEPIGDRRRRRALPSVDRRRRASRSATAPRCTGHPVQTSCKRSGRSDSSRRRPASSAPPGQRVRLVSRSGPGSSAGRARARGRNRRFATSTSPALQSKPLHPCSSPRSACAPSVALGPGLKMPAAGPAHHPHYSFQPGVSAVVLIVVGAVAVSAWMEGSGGGARDGVPGEPGRLADGHRAQPGD
jgi:hypothetical protein